MRSTPPFVFAVVCSTLTAAHAAPDDDETPPPPPASTHPDDGDGPSPPRPSEGWIDRPLLLDSGQVQAGIAIEESEPGSSYEVSAGKAVMASIAAGVGAGTQLGLAFSAPFDPSAFGSLSGSAVFGRGERMAFRIDAGVSRTTELGTGDPNNDPMATNAYSLAFGVPIKVKLSPNIAFVSGTAGPTGFGLPFAQNAPHGVSMAAGSRPSYFGESIVAVVVKDSVPNDYVFTLPVGLLVAPTDRFALRLHGAYQMIFSGARGEEGPFSDTFLLAGADLMISLPGHVDLGASVDTVTSESSKSTRYPYNWAEGGVTQLAVWMQGRFGP
jgi:hypothetical protein